MFPYLIIILLGSILSYIAHIKRKDKTTFFILSSLVILILSTFSGVRDLNVGYDVMYYQYNAFKWATNCSSYTKLLAIASPLEPLFLFINYIVAQFTNNIHYSLAAISFVSLTFAYLACVRLEKYASPWLLFTLYLLYYYATSNNLMRQSIALSISFYAFSILLTNGLTKKYIIISVLAIFAHRSTLFPTLFFALNHIIFYKFNNLKFIYQLLLLATCCTIYVYWGALLTIFSSVLDKDYTIYSEENTHDWSNTHIPSYLIIFSIIGYFLIYYLKLNKQINADLLFYYKCFLLINLLCICLGNHNGSAVRLSLYFMTILTFYLCMFMKIDSLKHKFTYGLLLITMYIIFFFYRFYDGLEYSSTILGI